MVVGDRVRRTGRISSSMASAKSAGVTSVMPRDVEQVLGDGLGRDGLVPRVVRAECRPAAVISSSILVVERLRVGVEGGLARRVDGAQVGGDLVGDPLARSAGRTRRARSRRRRDRTGRTRRPCLRVRAARVDHVGEEVVVAAAVVDRPARPSSVRSLSAAFALVRVRVGGRVVEQGLDVHVLPPTASTTLPHTFVDATTEILPSGRAVVAGRRPRCRSRRARGPAAESTANGRHRACHPSRHRHLPGTARKG